MKQMPPNMKHIILANMNVKVYSYISQGSAATYAAKRGVCVVIWLYNGEVAVLIPPCSTAPF